MENETTKKPVIAGIGELLWDVFNTSEKLGGAPVNFAYHAGALGAESYPISTIGDDDRGKAALVELQNHGVSTDHITVLRGALTGYVRAQVDSQGVASYTFPDNVAWDRIYLKEKTMLLAEKLDAICFGTLVQRSESSREVVENYLKILGKKTLKVCDLNLRQQFYSKEIIHSSLEYADVLKLNDEEIIRVAELEHLTGDEEAQLRLLVERYGLQLAVLTRGAHGSLLVSPSAVSNHPGYDADIVDTVGAGDSFTATTILGLLQGYSLDTINDHANRVAAFVCSQQGAMPYLPEGYRMC